MNTRTRCAAAALCLPLLAACGDSTSPERGTSSIDLVFVSASKMYLIRNGAQPEPTGITDILPYATTDDAVAYFPEHVPTGGQGGLQLGTLHLLHLDGAVDSLPVAPSLVATPGAISPDGSLLAYASLGAGPRVFVNVVELGTGARDSTEVTNREDIPAAPQAIASSPMFSPSGDSVAFLLPNFLTVQVLIYEVRSKRVEVHVLPVPVSTFARPLIGSPRWTRSGKIHFLAQRLFDNQLLDSLVVMSVDARNPQLPAEVVFTVGIPDSLPIGQFDGYSFDGSGDRVVFSMRTNGALGLFLAQRGSERVLPLLFDPALPPSFSQVIP